MEQVKELPIFCDNCPTLAFASLDGAPLCEACLLEAVKREPGIKVEPLTFREPRMVGVGRDDSRAAATHGQ